METSYFFQVGQGLLLALSLVLVMGCGGGTKRWVPPTKGDIPADVDPDVVRLIEKTFSENWAERADAAHELGRVGDRATPAIPFLIRLLADEEGIGTTRAAPCTEAAGALDALGKPAVPHLIAALDAENNETRGEALCLLAYSGDQRAVDPIIGALNDPDPKVRRWAASYVGKMRENRAVERLIALLDDRETFDEDPSEPVAQAAISALSRIKDTRAVKPLIAVLEDRKRLRGVRVEAASSLGFIGDRRAAEALVGRYNDPKEDLRIRAKAAAALAQLKDPRAFEMLTDLLERDEDYARMAAIGALAVIADDRSVLLLTKLLDTEKTNEFEGSVVFSLVHTDKPAAIDAVIQVLNEALDRNEWGGVVQKIDALTLSSNPRAYVWGIEALSSRSEDVASWVLRALAKGECYGDIWMLHMDTGPERRAQALKDPRIVDPLIAIVKDPKADERMRAKAITALRKTEDPRAIEFLDSVEGEETRRPQPEPEE